MDDDIGGLNRNVAQTTLCEVSRFTLTSKTRYQILNTSHHQLALLARGIARGIARDCALSPYRSWRSGDRYQSRDW